MSPIGRLRDQPSDEGTELPELDGPLGRRFLTVWSGQTISAVGSMVSGVGFAVYVFLATQSTIWLGALTALVAAPAVVLIPLLRNLDRWSLRRVMIGGDLIAAAAAGAMLALAMSGRIRVWHLAVGAVISGAGEAFRAPAFSAAVPTLVGPAGLDRANGLNQVGGALGATIGPVVAAPLVAWWGIQAVLVLDLVTFAAALGTTLAVRFGRSEPAAETDRGSWAPARRWLLGPGRPVTKLLALIALVNLVLSGFSVAVLALAVEVGGASWAGLPLAAGGVAMIGSSAVIGARGLADERMRAVVISLFGFGFGCVVAAAHPSLGVVAVGMVVAMASVPAASAAMATIFHERVPHGLQGRVFALRGAIGQGLGPIGSLGSGLVIAAVAVPAMAPDGLAGRSIGTLIGPGGERGPALFLIGCGLALVTLAVLAGRIRGLGAHDPGVGTREASRGASAPR